MNPRADPLLLLMYDLATGGCKLRVVNGDRLVIDAPRGFLTDPLRSQIKAPKPALIAFGLGRYRRDDFAVLLESMHNGIANSEQ
jgi:hypothetical protein